ncbi:MAG: HAMP domain-containing histidine kinase [Pyrinomonadaceae bacterium MAG19_C2-C3]|nr:HAMP domain-containing histidine kinase [Pyrinomonadaceae bacterium MAG19_C2-C3]
MSDKSSPPEAIHIKDFSTHGNFPVDYHDLHALSAEVVGLFYAQATTADELKTDAGICLAFSAILQRYWHLCSIVTLLEDESGAWREIGIHADHHIDKTKAIRTAHLLAVCVSQQGKECQLWLNENYEVEPDAVTNTGEPTQTETSDEDSSHTASSQVPLSQSSTSNASPAEVEEARAAFKILGVRAGIAVPIHARGHFVGAFIAMCAKPEDLREAVAGIRFIAAPIVIALSNAKHAEAMNKQQSHIARLVEDLREHSTRLEDANRELQRVARYRSMFLARMSHELRTPLTSILGFCEILLDQETLTAPQRRFCEKIQSSGLQQQESLNQLVDLSRLEAGQSELFLHEFSLREMLREVCDSLARQAKKLDVTIECAINGDHSTIVSDEGKLRRVVYNFLAFAISRSPAGTRVAIASEQFSATHFRISVSDGGEHLTDAESIFETFEAMSKAERGSTLNELGLVIAHRLINVLGGTVELTDLKPRGLQVKLEFAPNFHHDADESEHDSFTS